MNETNVQVGDTTLETAERIAHQLNCSVEEVVRDAVTEYAINQGRGVDAAFALDPAEPESELAIVVAMPVVSRKMTVRISKRTTLNPSPILPEIEEAV